MAAVAVEARAAVAVVLAAAVAVAQPLVRASLLASSGNL